MPLKARLASLARGLLAVGLAAAFVLASVTAGTRYLWCVPMQRVMSTCCVTDDDPADAARPTGRDAPAARPECCETHAFAALPATDRPQAPADLPHFVTAAVVAQVPAVAHPTESPRACAGLPTSRSRNGIRAGPSCALERCVALRVFRC